MNNKPGEKPKSSSRDSGHRDETVDLRLSVREWDRDERVNDALRLGIVRVSFVDRERPPN